MLSNFHKQKNYIMLFGYSNISKWFSIHIER